jgi:Tfp pilus assembly protein PilX
MEQSFDSRPASAVAAPRRQRGAVLLTALFLMLAVLMIGVSAARSALNADKSARHDRDRQIAFNAAQAALQDAERDIEGGADPASPRAALFAPLSAGFAGDCGQGAASANLGLCLPALAPAAPVWQALDLGGAGAATVPYGRFTGAVMAVAGGPLPARLPRYIIERVALAGAAPSHGAFYRITAIGFGSRDATRVVLQSYYRRPLAAVPAPPVAAPGSAPQPGRPLGSPPAALPMAPPGRISWREIANWPELHRAAQI